MIKDKIYQLSIVGISILLLVVSISHWLTSNELKQRNLELEVVKAEGKVLEISNSSLVTSINKQSNTIRELEAKQKARELEAAKTITKIDTKYITKYELVKDLNETAECEALKRIIDEEVNSSASSSGV